MGKNVRREKLPWKSFSKEITFAATATLTSKDVAGVFAVFATEKYTVASVRVEREHVEWRGV